MHRSRREESGEGGKDQVATTTYYRLHTCCALAARVEDAKDSGEEGEGGGAEDGRGEAADGRLCSLTTRLTTVLFFLFLVLIFSFFLWSTGACCGTRGGGGEMQ